MKEITAKDIKGIMGKYYLKDRPKAGALLFISAEWCGHCKRAKPELQNVSNITGTGFPIYKLDADRNKDLISQMGISGFPTIKFILPSGLISKDYTGQRKTHDILQSICTEAKKCY